MRDKPVLSTKVVPLRTQLLAWTSGLCAVSVVLAAMATVSVAGALMSSLAPST